ncbi:MAG: flagellar type III secretion system protein FliQ [Oscillospiraceae bacterium]|nr:flagellar type III secretion system protein FliQ [Oscillospiraceae bacterium]
MTEETILQILKEAIFVIFKIAGPLLIISMLVGMVIAILQAATQVHEQTLTFVPKALTMVVILFILGSFFTEVLEEFINYIFDIIAQIGSQAGVIE